jgi:hypothetical protein
MNDTGSLYDFIGKDYESPQQEVETPHQNRANLSQPYQGEFKKNIESAITEPDVSGGASHNFWLWFTRQQTKCAIAHGVNSQFDRKKLTDYDAEKKRYINLYNRSKQR